MKKNYLSKQVQNTLIFKFKDNPPVKLSKTIINLLKKNHSDSIKINKKNWSLISKDNLNNKMETCQLQNSLILSKNQQPKILDQIQHIKFPSLKQLSIQQNYIQSIEIMCRIELPSLHKLDFSYNNINCLKPIKRCHWPNIKQIIISNNLIMQSNSLNQLFAQKLQCIIFEQGDQSIVCQNFRYLTKLQIKNTIKQIRALSIKRIKQPSLIKLFNSQVFKSCIFVGN